MPDSLEHRPVAAINRADMTDMDVLDEMERTGGGFVKALAAAMYKADRDNLARLKAAFPEYWQTYSERAVRRKAEGR